MNRVIENFNGLASKLLTSFVTALFTLVVATGVSQASDIDIYQQAKAGDVSLMMVLDTSGSMGYPQLVGDRGACDVPAGVSISGSGSVDSTNGSPIYKRHYCNAVGSKTYKYRKESGENRYWRCTNEASARSDCTWGSRFSTKPAELDSLFRESTSSYDYYYEGMTRPYFDRITRLKDGMFDLLHGNTAKGIVRLADDKVIGLTTYSRPTSVNSSGEPTAADGLRALVRVPARRLDAVVGG